MSDNVKDPKELLMEGETGDSARIRAMEQEKQAAINEEIAEATSVKGQYSASQIQVLEGLEAVRKRPSMYIGSVSSRGLHHLVSEVVDNSIDEALAGFCTDIDVVIEKDNSITVRDNGRGIPVDMHKTGKPAIEVVMTVLHAGGKFGDGGYKVSGGLHGVGVSCVNALSEKMDVEVHRNGKAYGIEFSRGKTVRPLYEKGPAEGTGTMVHFKPDDTIFTETVYDYDTLRLRLRELAFLNKGVSITLKDERSGREEKFHFEGGIIEFVRYVDQNKDKINAEPIYVEGVKDTTIVEMAMEYTDSYNENIFTYVNNINTEEGGTHLSGFKQALTRAINDYARKAGLLKDNDDNLGGDDCREGLTAVLSLKVAEPQFEGQTKGRLGNSEVRPAVEGIITQQLTDWLENLKNQEIAQQIVQKAIRAAQVREAARKTRDNARKANQLDAAPLVGKLSACRGKKAEDNELFIVEGDSAGGSAKEGRDRHFQAILPLRGKILNVEKTRLDKALGNNEIKSMLTAFGCGFGDEFDESKLRYHRIVCMTDADVDGAHIRILMLTFFYRYMRPLVEKGYVYAAMPPLYKVTKGKMEKYVYDDDELQRLLDEIGRDPKPDIQRYKGLGEMSAEQLWQTTMNPETRTMMQITPEDAMAADEIFTLLMGDQVEPRRKFIEENADLVKDLDV